ncbi:MAG: ABC transporter substrate-binding protein [Acetobacteraceae bacterium]|nr:ABC transporter substrate-binding protein [Acetobacteraceae bacterium]
MAASLARWASASRAAGLAADTVKIGNTMVYSGAANYGAVGRAEAGYFQMVNDGGGIAGRHIDFISLDDEFSPPKTVEITRKLVEQDGVALILGSLGTPTSAAVQKYLNDRGVPQLFPYTGADKWGNYKQYPWTLGLLPSYRTEAQIYAKYILAHKQDARIGILYRNDDYGKDYIVGLRDTLGPEYDKMVVAALTHEATDATVDSQIVSLQSAGTDTFVLATAGKFAAQAIRKAYDIGWKPAPLFLSYVGAVGVVTEAAGAEKAVGIISAEFVKDPTDPAWASDPGLQEWRAFMTKYLPHADQSEVLYVHGYATAAALMAVLKQCGSDFSRANIMRQAANLHDVELPVLLPGIKLNTAPNNHQAIREMQLARWNGTTWQRFGPVIEGANL